jgi:hypothetical protein
LDHSVKPRPVIEQRVEVRPVEPRTRIAVEQRKAVGAENIDHGSIGEIAAGARLMQAGNGDRQGLPQPIGRQIRDPILAELNAVEEIETQHTGDQQNNAMQPSLRRSFLIAAA